MPPRGFHPFPDPRSPIPLPTLMEQLEAFYESTPKAVGFIERKIEIPSYTVNLFGPPKSGKTWLVLDYLSNIPKKRHIYIDLRDLRLDKSALGVELEAFIRRHRIETAVLDHYDGSVPLPSCRQCIVVTESPYGDNPFIPLLHCPTLDFEEFLAFERRPQDLEHSFSHYLRSGSLPAMSQRHDTLLTMGMHETLRLIFPDAKERDLFRTMARFQGKPISAHQLYTIVKKERRISKDWLYKTLKLWEDRGIVSYLPKAERTRAAAKALFFDFALPASLYFEKSLMGQLTVIAARRLMERHPDLLYSDRIDFIDPESRRAWLLSPFADARNGARRVAAAAEEIERYGIEAVTILTIANTFSFTFDKRPVKGEPFYQWMLGD